MSATPPGKSATTRPRRKLGSGYRTPWWHRVAERGLMVTAFAAILAVGLIFAFVLKEALPLLWDSTAQAELGGIGSLLWPRQWDGYGEAAFVWQPVGEPSKFNLVPLFAGTLKVTFLSMLVSVPLGVGAAIFVNQYAPRRLAEFIKPALELLASIPSVVLGFFALMVLAGWLQNVFGFAFRLNALVAAVGLSLAVVPLIFTISEDALQAVPRSLSEASMALGARKWHTIIRVTLPAAVPGITAAVVLGFGRAVGETMVVLMASGNAAVIELFNPASSARTVTATIAAELGEVSQGDPHWRVLFLLGAVLFVFTFIVNRIGTMVTERLQKRLTGAK